MSKNIKIDGVEVPNATTLKVFDTDTQDYVCFIDTSDADAAEYDIVAGKTAYINGAKITGTYVESGSSELDGMVDGTLTSFIMPVDKTTIAPYRFYGFTGLTSANLGGVQSVGDYAFNGCTYINNLVLPTSITHVGNYAFKDVGKNTSVTFDFVPSGICSLGTDSFEASNLKSITGTFGDIKGYSFNGCTKLTDVNITACSLVGARAFYGCTALQNCYMRVNGEISTYAFYNLNNVSSFDIDTNSVVSALGTYAFSGVGSGRANPHENIIMIDLRNSTFPVIGQYAFGTSSSTAINQYMCIRFPATVTSINTNAFRNANYCDYYFYGDTPASIPTSILSSSSPWYGAADYNIFVPYTSLSAYQSEWSRQEAYIKGFSKANTFLSGATLPTDYIWYSDSGCTNQITTVSDATQEYYCVAV